MISKYSVDIDLMACDTMQSSASWKILHWQHWFINQDKEKGNRWIKCDYLVGICWWRIFLFTVGWRHNAGVSVILNGLDLFFLDFFSLLLGFWALIFLLLLLLLLFSRFSVWSLHFFLLFKKSIFVSHRISNALSRFCSSWMLHTTNISSTL